MGRAPCCSKVGLKRGVWIPKEDSLLVNYILTHGEGYWKSLPKKAGLLRCGKSCRLRWKNYLHPDIKRGNISPDEEDLIIRLHSLLGNRWSLIAGRIPGRTDNEIKNHWNSHLSKKLAVMNSDTHVRSHTVTKGTKGPEKRISKTANISIFEYLRPRDDKAETITKIKVHKPKAVRLSRPPILSYEKVRNESTSYDDGVEECFSLLELNNDNNNTHRIQEHEEEQDYENILINYGCDVSLSDMWHEHEDLFFPNFDSVIDATANRKPSNDDNKNSEQTLDKIFEEYQELFGAEDHARVFH